MKILAIETSCDDTSVAVLKAEGKNPAPEQARYGASYPRFKILTNVVSSQVAIHEKWGGVFPSLAKREHQKNLPPILENILRKNPKIDLAAITQGPGLEPCLWVGINFAKSLSKKLGVPLIPINHIEAHILANFLNPKHKIQNTKYLFPAICLVVSGGHTQLILMEKIGKYKIIGETRDDAAGECFDKVARILGLGYPGGPAVSAEAENFKENKSKLKVVLPRPMISQKNYDFSFSGLKTAVLYLYQKSKIKNKKLKQAICAETQQAIIDVLIAKTTKAAKDFKAKSIILGGGVTANKELRKQFAEKIRREIPNTKYLIPNTKYSTDNAVMIAATAYYNFRKNPKKDYGNIEAKANLRISEKP